MAGYHQQQSGKKKGDWVKCSAPAGKCPFRDENGQPMKHYDTLEEAHAADQKQAKNEFGQFPSVKSKTQAGQKSSKKNNLSDTITAAEFEEIKNKHGLEFLETAQTLTIEFDKNVKAEKAKLQKVNPNYKPLSGKQEEELVKVWTEDHPDTAKLRLSEVMRDAMKKTGKKDSGELTMTEYAKMMAEVEYNIVNEAVEYDKERKALQEDLAIRKANLKVPQNIPISGHVIPNEVPTISEDEILPATPKKDPKDVREEDSAANWLDGE